MPLSFYFHTFYAKRGGRKGTVSRVLSFDSADRRNQKDGHLSGTLIAQDLKRPYPSRLHSVEEADLNGLFLSPRTGREKRDLFGLAPGGVYQAALIAQCAGELLPRLFTLTHLSQGFNGRYLFCGTFLVPSLGRWNRPCYGPPCPAELGLSSPRSSPFEDGDEERPSLPLPIPPSFFSRAILFSMARLARRSAS